jgi:hypothetical protein
MTTPQAGLSMSASQAYREKMFNLLADRNPLEVLAQTASALADIVGKHSATVLRTRRRYFALGHLKGNGLPTKLSAI